MSSCDDHDGMRSPDRLLAVEGDPLLPAVVVEGEPLLPEVVGVTPLFPPVVVVVAPLLPAVVVVVPGAHWFVLGVKA